MELGDLIFFIESNELGVQIFNIQAELIFYSNKMLLLPGSSVCIVLAFYQ